MSQWESFRVQIVSSLPEPTQSVDSEAAMYRRFYERERNARIQAEEFLEKKSRELYLSNQKLSKLAVELEKEVLSTKADLKRRKELESQLAHTQKMESVGQLAAGVAHELNTPIQFVSDNISFLETSFSSVDKLLGRVEALLDRCREEDDLSSHVASIDELSEEIDLEFIREEAPLAASQAREGTMTLAHIVKAMKVFSHPGSKAFENANLNQLLDSTLNVSRSEWKYHARLETDYCNDLPQVVCLPSELCQVFLNLIVNAANAMASNEDPGDSVLSVATRRENEFAVVEIGDTGCGILEDIRHRVFDPFFTTKSVGEGTGQGLSISYRIIVKLHGGSLTFTSNVGQGTKFKISLPLNSKIAVGQIPEQ